jgi:hypothetical protein
VFSARVRSTEEVVLASDQPTAMIVDSRTLQSTRESGARAGYDGAERRKGSKVHAAVDIRVI